MAVAPPPGLEDAMMPLGLGATEDIPTPPGFEDAMLPAKIDLAASLGVQPGPLLGPWMFADCCLPDEWLNAVMSVTPHLGAEGLRSAAEIVDLAAEGARQEQALEAFLDSLSSPHQQSYDPFVISQIVAAEIQRTQVRKQQEALLQQLQSLLAAAPVAALAAEQHAAALAVEQTAAALAAEQCAALEGPPGLDKLEQEEAHEAKPAVATCALAQTVGQPQRAATGPVQTLSGSLQLLSKEDPDRLFIVRRINKLGFKAPRKLRQHFSAYGAVVRVLVAHSTVRPSGDPQCHSRRRPSSLGFVQMQSAKAVQQILAWGDDHEVGGCAIRVQRFERQVDQGRGAEAPLEEDEAEDAEDAAGDEEAEKAQEPKVVRSRKLSAQELMQRQLSAVSTTFTSTSAESEGSSFEQDQA